MPPLPPQLLSPLSPSPSPESDYNTTNYGATQALIVKGQSKAKKRVFYFLTVFIVNGFFSEFQLALEQLPVMINV